MFLKSSGMALVAGGLLPGVFVRMAEAGTSRGKKTLVVVFQRGAVDGLNVVVPYGESDYYKLRPNIAIPRPGSAPEAALDLDGFFGLHPSLASLQPLFRDRSLAFVHATGSPDNTRSHFDAQDFMESGTPGLKATADGFLSRTIQRMPGAKVSPLRAVSLTPTMPRILTGAGGAVAMSDITRFGIQAGGASTLASDSFESMYGNAVDQTLGGTARDSFEAMKILKGFDPARLQPENGATYPAGPFGSSMKQIAQLIKGGVGLEVAFTDIGGWDTHVAEGNARGQLANNLRNYAVAISAFARDLGSRMGDVVLVTVSEFGRTVRENGNRGTDHGHGNVMIVMGGGVRGGKVHGQWPGLAAGSLYENRDLAVTTDFRDVFGEVLTKQLGVSDLGPVFPNYVSSPRKWRGVMG